MITLIGKDLAEKELVFTYNKPAKECESCRFKSSCVDSLEEGRKYIITDVKENEQICPIHDTGHVNVVEVEKANITSFIDSKKSFKGSRVVHSPPECDIKCIYHEYCFPEGINPGEKCTVENIIEKNIDGCGKGYLLNKVILKV
ncbi:UPF0179 family protein [Methanobrevibacter filiformis]|uniref:UPF0179 protein MBFIL_17460 n=1 Tax=Methanobrevibacter filiformis TaxID=55758 RepID=A0A166C0W2_9EURY|nr:UPF0179 family protein [Methanobrevibacter filiformis]KZX10447.1 hypothetical protein MBFIL_17460 [Methanobrevibacter filiformis]